MCLSTINLNLKWEEKEKAYVGYGYKNLNEDFLTVRGYCKNQWRKASGNQSLRNDKLSETLINSSQYTGKFDEYGSGIREQYHPGYHIFLNLKDAKDYSCQELFRVKFKGVISFGGNVTSRKKHAPTVVATHVKLLEKIDV